VRFFLVSRFFKERLKRAQASLSSLHPQKEVKLNHKLQSISNKYITKCTLQSRVSAGGVRLAEGGSWFFVQVIAWILLSCNVNIQWSLLLLLLGLPTVLPSILNTEDNRNQSDQEDNEAEVQQGGSDLEGVFRSKQHVHFFPSFHAL